MTPLSIVFSGGKVPIKVFYFIDLGVVGGTGIEPVTPAV